MRRYVTFSRNNLAPVHMGSDRFLWHLGTMTATHIWAVSVQSKTGHAARRRKIYIRILVRLGVLWRQERTSLPCCGMEHGMTEVNLYGNIVSASVDDPCFQHIHLNTWWFMIHHNPPHLNDSPWMIILPRNVAGDTPLQTRNHILFLGRLDVMWNCRKF